MSSIKLIETHFNYILFKHLSFGKIDLKAILFRPQLGQVYTCRWFQPIEVQEPYLVWAQPMREDVTL